jgi:putative spermidine/putrescine transport system permease protein
MSAIMVLPLLMGLLARNYSWIGLLSNPGSIGNIGKVLFGAKFLYSQNAVVLVMTSVFVPISYFILVQGVRSIRAVQFDAAQTLGLTDYKIVFFVMLPMTIRAAILAFGFVFAFSVGFFVTPSMLGGGNYDFIGNAILVYINFGRFEIASTISLAFLGLILAPAIVIAWYALKRRHFVSGR